MPNPAARDFRRMTSWDSYSQSQDFIPFNQYFDVISNLDPKRHYTLLNINRKYSGLCEIICNLMLTSGLLGKGSNSRYLRDRITIENLDNDKIKKSHILAVYSLFRKVIAYLFGIYPDNIFSCVDQWRLVKWRTRVVDRQVLAQGLSNIPEGETLKLEVFGKSCLNLSGHSLLIKKTSDESFIFFDPNTGEDRNLSLVQVSDKIDGLLAFFNASDVLLMRGNDYLARLHEIGLAL